MVEDIKLTKFQLYHYTVGMILLTLCNGEVGIL